MAALLKALEGDDTAAVELYTLAKQHPFVANSKWFEDVIGQEIENAARNLDFEMVEVARQTGESLNLWETAEALVGSLKPII